MSEKRSLFLAAVGFLVCCAAVCLALYNAFVVGNRINDGLGLVAVIYFAGASSVLTGRPNLYFCTIPAVAVSIAVMFAKFPVGCLTGPGVLAAGYAAYRLQEKLGK